MTTTTTRGRRGQRARRIGTRAALVGTGIAGLLAVTTPANAYTGTVPPGWIAPGGEACAAASATASVYASGTAYAPGLKFKLIAQTGVVVDHTTGPVTAWAAQTGVGYPSWQGAGDYTACAKNNGTQSVYLSSLSITTS